MTDTSKLECPECGARMNHHAVKIEYDSEKPATPAFDGIVKNVYTCPKCGAVEMTTAE